MNISSPISFQALNINERELAKYIDNHEDVIEKYEIASGQLSPLLDTLERKGIDIDLARGLTNDFLCLSVMNKKTGDQETCITPGVGANAVRSLSMAISKAFEVLLNKQ